MSERQAAFNLWEVIQRASFEAQREDLDPNRLRILIEPAELQQAVADAPAVAEAMRKRGIGNTVTWSRIRHLPNSLADYIDPPDWMQRATAGTMRSFVSDYADLHYALDVLIGALDAEASDALYRKAQWFVEKSANRTFTAEAINKASKRGSVAVVKGEGHPAYDVWDALNNRNWSDHHDAWRKALKAEGIILG